MIFPMTPYSLKADLPVGFPYRFNYKLDMKQDINVLYQVCVFQADPKMKMAALASDNLKHYRLFQK